MARIVHLAVKVEDLESAAEFYEKVFGFRRSSTVSKRGHTSCHMTDGSFDLALIKYDSEDVPEAGLAGPGPRLHHIGIAVDDVEQTQKKLTEYGCEILSQPGVMPIKFRSPDGVIAEVGPAEVYPGVSAKR